MELGILIRERMKAKRIGNKTLAELSGIPLGTFNKIIYGETSNPTIDNVIAIAHALGCTVDELLEETDSISYSPTVIAAHHDNEEWTEEELDEIEQFKTYVKSKRDK